MTIPERNAETVSTTAADSTAVNSMTGHLAADRALAMTGAGSRPEVSCTGLDARTAGTGGLRRVVLALGAALLPGQPERALRMVLEDALTNLWPAKSVRVRDMVPGELVRRGVDVRGPDLVVLEVPGGEAGRRTAVEVRLDGTGRLGPAGLEDAGAAAALAALVVEAERARRPRAVRGERPAGVVHLLGESAVMQRLRDRLARVAPTDFTVLVEGESGTGKELVARCLHQGSSRQQGPFVAVNCAAIVDTLLEAELFGIEERTATGVRGRRGKFELADGGTLFLDEVSDLSPAAQAKLLRAIQELAVERVGGRTTTHVDVRIVAASNRPLGELVAAGAFRADLYYRLSGVEVQVPPLRSRAEDIPGLVLHFLDHHRHARRLTLSPQAMAALLLHRWPGNVRELERVVERTVALAPSSEVEVEDLPPAIRGDAGLHDDAGDESMRAWGSRYARMVYVRCGRNKREACRRLGISYHTLDAYLRYAHHRSGGRRQMPAWVTRSYGEGGLPAGADILGDGGDR